MKFCLNSAYVLMVFAAISAGIILKILGGFVHIATRRY